jgi:eukaryotic-like serine/threonine-protein kinase
MDYLLSSIYLLLANPYAPWIILGVGGVFLYQKLAPRLRLRVGSGLSLDGLVGSLLGPRYAQAKVQREVERQKKAGNYIAAGKILEDREQFAEAVEVYLSGDEFWAAASTLERLGKLERAAENYLQAGDYKKAAQMFTDAGKPARAASLFQEKGNNLEAARLYALAGSWAAAADLYIKSGYPLRAAEAYEKKGDYLKAAECFEKHFMENVSFATTYSSTAAPTADQKSALLAGRLYEKAGDPNKALQIFMKGGYFKEAAGACMTAGQFTKAAELYLRADDPTSAAQAYEQAGDHIQAANLRGEAALKADRVPEAAAFFQKGEDYLRSAELFESVGMLAEAAGAYEAGESWAAAGSVYIRAGLKDRAASSYERAGEFENAAKLYEGLGDSRRAVELYEKAGFTFKSGEAAAKAGHRDKAIALLQRVGPTDENYADATELLARLFIEGGMPALAVERLEKVLAGQAVAATNLDLYYWLGVGYETSGHTAQALGIYKKILSEDLHFRDVETRAARLFSSGDTPTKPMAAVPATGPMTPAAPSPPPDSPPAVSPAPPAPVRAEPGPSSKQRFVSKEELGRGPLGTILRGEDRVDSRSVALRALPAEALKASGLLQALVADLKAASQLSHPNLVKVLGLVEVDGQRCVVTELVTGRNLAEALKAGHKMSFSQVHSLGRVLCQTLVFVHGKGLVHGSIRPSNIMVASGVLKLADLGLGRLAASLSPNGDYSAPENQLDVSGDLYATSAVLYHLLTGLNPKQQPQGVGLPLPSRMATGVPETFDKLLLRCLHPRPELRLQTAEDILRELKDMVRLG